MNQEAIELYREEAKKAWRARQSEHGTETPIILNRCCLSMLAEMSRKMLEKGDAFGGENPHRICRSCGQLFNSRKKPPVESLIPQLHP